ncbi:MAG TPA: carboxypeptidase-like regulatory domain-containing protein [Kofleriaceae bacterium]|nr:carboxypeptidase-like regulatory domain-containing protein [Kofleriaceae bacterium]
MTRALLVLTLVIACDSHDEAAAPQPVPRAAATAAAVPAPAGKPVIAGSVVDSDSGKPVAGAVVVFRAPTGEATAKTDPTGAYRLELARGSYRAFVRDERVISVGELDRVRLSNLPAVDTIGVADEALMPVVVVERSASGVDLAVVRAGRIVGHVYDPDGKPLGGVALRAQSRSGLRPILGTDRARTDATGAYELRVPAGEYVVDAVHAKYSGSTGMPVPIAAGGQLTRDLTLRKGCVIAGRVVGPTGKPVGDGAIERSLNGADLDFAPTGAILSDGTFRWITNEDTFVSLRAWPWKSAASPVQHFECHDGARREGIVLRVPDVKPDMEGVLVDARGAPAPFAYLDVAPLDPTGFSQQERTDADGRWAVFHMPTGRYRITTQAPGRGVVATTLEAPAHDVKLQLSGVGRLEGTTTQLATGSFELRVVGCRDGVSMIPVPEDRRLVLVTGGRFSVEDVPACEVELAAAWHGKPITVRTTITANATARIELALGPPYRKRVTGIVRDVDGHAVPGAIVKATLASPDHEATHDVTAVSDESGRYAIETVAGATLTASEHARIGSAKVGLARVDAEQVDVRIVAHAP